MQSFFTRSVCVVELYETTNFACELNLLSSKHQMRASLNKLDQVLET